MDTIKEFLGANTNILWAVIASAIVSASVSYFFRKRETRHRLATEYEYEQRKKLRDVIGRHHGRMLNATNSLSRRLWNLYSNHEQNWLDVKTEWSPDDYYFMSFVYRFLTVASLIRSFEKEAVFVDARIAEPDDFKFLRYMAAFQWCATDVSLFKGVDYDYSKSMDHVYSDTLRQCGDAFLDEEGNTLEFEAFMKKIEGDQSYGPILYFFKGLKQNEDRFRWDRLVALHLLLVGFINIIGYPEHHTSQSQMEAIAGKIVNKGILQNLAAWLPKHGLNDKQAREILRACNKVS